MTIILLSLPNVSLCTGFLSKEKSAISILTVFSECLPWNVANASDGAIHIVNGADTRLNPWTKNMMPMSPDTG